MKIQISDNVTRLIVGPKNWLSSSTDIHTSVQEISGDGVYCLWWKNPLSFPEEKAIELPAGNRGIITLTLKTSQFQGIDSIALYIGKGSIKTRLKSHFKPSERNPHQWLTKIFPNEDIDELIKENIGFSFIEESNKLEQIYTENLAIGILQPWFNLRLTS